MIDNQYTCWTVIVYYNGAEWIERCLGAFSNTNFEDKLIVVDNYSTDRTGIEIITAKFPKVTLITLDSNIGFGQANNIGIEWAIKRKAKYIFLLNQDAWICANDSIENLIQVSINNPNFGIISPIHYNSTKTALDQGFATYVANSKNADLLSDIFVDNQKSIYEIPFVNAAAWLLNVECFKKIGFFDPDFFMYGEDTDLINRVLFHQLSIGFTPLASICHAREYRLKEFPKNHLTFSETIQYNGRYLSILKNINENFIKSIIKSITECSVNILQEISQNHWNRAFQIFKIIIKLFLKLPNILIKRRQFQKGIPNN